MVEQLLTLLYVVGSITLVCWLWAHMDTWKTRWSDEFDRAHNLQLVVNDLTRRLHSAESLADEYHRLLEEEGFWEPRSN